jgi:predicted transposase/invertase (TIGR01784 family)
MFATKLQQYGERLKEEARYEEKRETARALKEQGVAVEVIARATGLSEEEIRAL